MKYLSFGEIIVSVSAASLPPLVEIEVFVSRIDGVFNFS